MIVLFTANSKGGVVQFILQLLVTLKGIGYDAKAFIPENASFSLDEEYLPLISRYKKVKTIYGRDKRLKDIASKIIESKPDYVWFVDESIVSSQLLILVRNQTETIMSIHDVMPHPFYFDVKLILLKKFESIIRKNAVLSASFIILMSLNAMNIFDRLYKGHKKKILILPLGAHVPHANPEMPEELERFPSHQKYFMFFGRIDRYKGLMRLIEAFEKLDMDNKPKLVIAGSGTLTETEAEHIKNNKDIILIKRFIRDEEMVFLFRNALSVVLPYIEASQSGVLPMAYYFSVPVIVSYLEGLTEYVISGDTGFICKTVEEIADSMERVMIPEQQIHMKQKIKEYYSEKLDWENNLRKCLGEIKK